MKNKTLEDTTQALKNFFNESDVKKFKSYMCVFMSDSDSSFQVVQIKGMKRILTK